MLAQEPAANVCMYYRKKYLSKMRYFEVLIRSKLAENGINCTVFRHMLRNLLKEKNAHNQYDVRTCLLFFGGVHLVPDLRDRLLLVTIQSPLLLQAL